VAITAAALLSPPEPPSDRGRTISKRPFDGAASIVTGANAPDAPYLNAHALGPLESWARKRRTTCSRTWRRPGPIRAKCYATSQLIHVEFLHYYVGLVHAMYKFPHG
jgi:hypothetical protein